MRRRPLLAAALATLALAGAAVAGCGDDGVDVAAERIEQVRAAATEAGLPTKVVDVLALAATGATATFRVTYAGTDGASIVVSQQPPDRRIDVVVGKDIVESRVLRHGVGYACAPAGDAGPLECERKAGSLRADGAFTPEAIDRFTQQLAVALPELDVTVETRTIADTEATCLISQPKPGTVLDENAPSVDTICLSPQGAQLLVDSAGQRVVATAYGTDVPDGTFDVERVR